MRKKPRLFYRCAPDRRGPALMKLLVSFVIFCSNSDSCSGYALRFAASVTPGIGSGGVSTPGTLRFRYTS